MRCWASQTSHGRSSRRPSNEFRRQRHSRMPAQLDSGHLQSGNTMPNDSTRRSAVFRLGKGVTLYALSRSAGGVVRILTVPFIVHAVSATEFGTLATLWIPMFIAHGVCDLGLGTAAV